MKLKLRPRGVSRPEQARTRDDYDWFENGKPRRTFSGRKLPVVLSATALIIALAGATPLGQAAGNAIAKAVPRALFANNAGKLNGHTSSPSPKAGQIPVVGQNGKLAASLSAGISGYEVVRGSGSATLAPGESGNDGAVCPAGKKPLGGGVNSGQVLSISVSAPDGQAWYVIAQNAGSQNTVFVAYAICAIVSS